MCRWGCDQEIFHHHRQGLALWSWCASDTRLFAPRRGTLWCLQTQVMSVHGESLATLVVVVWLGGTRPRINADEMRSYITAHFRIDHHCFKFKPHLSEDFLATFNFSHHCDLVAMSLGRFEQDGLDVHVTKWRLSSMRRQSMLPPCDGSEPG
ncbi:hypothetical protein D1007_29995 [Hordeum vulgare]|nr:hypothetical protein D1007_29995 [Hordeum vulgare]